LLTLAVTRGAVISDLDDPRGGLRITFSPRQREARRRMLDALARLAKRKRAVRIAGATFTVRCPRCGRPDYRLLVV